ncbi:hypothetical protein LMG18091_02227 [Ralstonia wenshanensis]|uniref:Uncharacterized protein n=2 Tax=Ralstonia wenshanensis TaxID=2842456 RepID=A0AAD2EQU4_9RALS|nr:hypothetical protein LMG18091_02227 [Ralstonia wenshanensis]
MEVGLNCNIEDEQAFSLTAGPLAIHFEDGRVMGVASDPSLNSIIVWDERRPDTDRLGPPLDKDSELFPILASDERFSTKEWSQLAGLTLSTLSILKSKRMNAKQRTRPSEVGLRLTLDGGLSLIASHCLLDAPDDFSVIQGSDLIADEFDEFALGQGGSRPWSPS